MMTILQIIPSLGAGGAEQACVDVAAGLKATGHRPIVISSGGPRVAEIMQMGGEHFTRPVHSKNPLRMMQNAFWLARFVRERKVDIIHARSRAPAWSALWASRMTGCAFVTTNHAAYKFSSDIKKFYNSVMVRSDRIIAISDFIAAHIQKHYGVVADKIRTIPRGIDLDKFALEKVTEARRDVLRQTWNVSSNQQLILVPSRLSSIKGQSVLIEAMALLPYSLQNVTAIILGHDQGRVGYRQQLADLISAKKLQDRIKLVEHCNDMPAAYSLASLVVAPSLVPEGFGRVPVEAMIMGVPVVATELGGFTETIRAGVTGWLVPPNDAKALADAIIKAFAQTAEERTVLVLTAGQHARALYDKNKMVADTISVYEELARPK
jgi:glycosyltransferase involved in cell wall biosynthesis